jgi:hypothetical protein
MSLYPFYGYCNSAGEECISFRNDTFWQYVDDLNELYREDVYNSVPTDFVSSAPDWYKYVVPMTASCMVMMTLCFLLFLYGVHFAQPEFKRQSYALVTLILLVSALLSWWAANIALTSQMLSPTSNSYVQSWYVYSEVTNGCNGPLYIPGSGIIMQIIGGINAVILSMVIYNDYGILVARATHDANPIPPVIVYQNSPPVNPNNININLNTTQPSNQYAFPNNPNQFPNNPNQYPNNPNQAPPPLSYAQHDVDIPYASVQIESSASQSQYPNKY